MRQSRTSKKDNLFVASRFVLPEHREMYLRVKEHQARYMPPDVDEEQMAAFSMQISQAMREKWETVITYYDGLKPQEIQGHVTHSDLTLRRIKVKNDETVEWIPYAHLLKVEVFPF